MSRPSVQIETLSGSFNFRFSVPDSGCYSIILYFRATIQYFSRPPTHALCFALDMKLYHALPFPFLMLLYSSAVLVALTSCSLLNFESSFYYSVEILGKHASVSCFRYR